MQQLNVLELTKSLIEINSVSRLSNRPIADYLQSLLEEAHWQIERTEYIDPNGEQKINLVAKLGEGKGGLALCSHNDTVPGQEQDWSAFTPIVRDGVLYGRGSCDMKGPLAATMTAAFSVDPATLKKPLYIVVTADEELGLIGAERLVETSEMLMRDRPNFGIVAEPTRLAPVYSHKGYGLVDVTARGRAAHSSTGLGESALLKIAPFLAYLTEIDVMLRTDESYMNPIYTPPHHALNLLLDMGEAALNVTAPYAFVRVALRAMPDSRSEEAVEMICERARQDGLEVTSHFKPPLYAPISADLVQTAVTATGKQPRTVPFGTDGLHLQKVIDQIVILGPGDIAVAHTVGEHIEIAQLEYAVTVYREMIDRLCC